MNVSWFFKTSPTEMCPSPSWSISLRRWRAWWWHERKGWLLAPQIISLMTTALIISCWVVADKKSWSYKNSNCFYWLSKPGIYTHWKTWSEVHQWVPPQIRSYQYWPWQGSKWEKKKTHIVHPQNSFISLKFTFICFSSKQENYIYHPNKIQTHFGTL